MVCELEGYRWDAKILSETWRQDNAEIWETRQRIIDTEYINERAIATTTVVNRQRIKLMTQSMRTITSRKCTRLSRSTQQIAKAINALLEETSIQNWDLDTEQNVPVSAGTHSTRKTKEAIG